MAKNARKKTKKEPKKAGSTRAITKNILVPIIIFVLIVAGYIFLKKSAYFTIDTVRIIDDSHASALEGETILVRYGGENIFDINIDSLFSEIRSDYPAVKDVIIKKILPNTIEINIIPRIPIAKIKNRKYFPIDKTGMVLSPETETGKLPLIIGLSMWTRPRVGKGLEDGRVKSAISLLEALNKSSLISEYDVDTIDVSNYKNLSFCIEDGIQIKIGDEDFFAKLKKLKKTLAKPDLDKSNIRYIDLRFKDVIIGPK